MVQACIYSILYVVYKIYVTQKEADLQAVFVVLSTYPDGKFIACHQTQFSVLTVDDFQNDAGYGAVSASKAITGYM